jgi:nucleoside-diphosphate-sugar epimerase
LDDYNPHTVYGEAKAQMEKLTKAANLDCIWTIIRPVIIWGPWQTFYRDTLFRAMEKGYYFHPSGRSAVLGFGYIKNFVRQIDKLLQAESALVNQKTLYLGDGLFPLIEWMNGYCQELTGHKVRYLPRKLIRGTAIHHVFVPLPQHDRRLHRAFGGDITTLGAAGNLHAAGHQGDGGLGQKAPRQVTRCRR